MSDKTEGMRCPVDGAILVMSERSGVEIDYCPTCRGVWLDRGEIDKIIERNGRPPEPSSRHEPMPEYRAGGGRDYGHDHGQGYGPRKRKKSFLEQIFD